MKPKNLGKWLEWIGIGCIAYQKFLEIDLNVIFQVLPFPTSAKATILNVAIFFKSKLVVREEDDDHTDKTDPFV